MGGEDDSVRPRGVGSEVLDERPELGGHVVPHRVRDVHGGRPRQDHGLQNAKQELRVRPEPQPPLKV